MAWLLEMVKALVAMDWVAVVGAVVVVLNVLIALALVAPGPQPETFLQGVVNFLSKFSRK